MDRIRCGEGEFELGLREDFEETYVRGITGIVYSRYGGVMWGEDLEEDVMELTIRVYDRSMEELGGVRDKNHKVYKRTFKLPEGLFEDEILAQETLYTIIGQVEGDLLG